MFYGSCTRPDFLLDPRATHRVLILVGFCVQKLQEFAFRADVKNSGSLRFVRMSKTTGVCISCGRQNLPQTPKLSQENLRRRMSNLKNKKDNFDTHRSKPFTDAEFFTSKFLCPNWDPGCQKWIKTGFENLFPKTRRTPYTPGNPIGAGEIQSSLSYTIINAKNQNQQTTKKQKVRHPLPVIKIQSAQVTALSNGFFLSSLKSASRCCRHWVFCLRACCYPI
jgi:hypothetical protein